jgi:hypothetical protein
MPDTPVAVSLMVEHVKGSGRGRTDVVFVGLDRLDR